MDTQEISHPAELKQPTEQGALSKHIGEESPPPASLLVDDLPPSQITSPRYFQESYKSQADSTKKRREKGCCSCCISRKKRADPSHPNSSSDSKSKSTRMSSGDEGVTNCSKKGSLIPVGDVGSAFFPPNDMSDFTAGSESALLAKLRKPSPKDLLVAVSSKTRSNKPRRTRIPNRPDISLSLWGIVKNAIGKDLSKLPLPVNFNEPLSMLQRLTEDYEYSSILDNAAEAQSPGDQMALVAAFSISSYASTAMRTGKPFNPLLGETFECDRTSDMGFKCFCEQVSHHPPTVAQHCIGKKWVCWQEFTMSSRFTGNSIEVTPMGIAHLLFPDSGNLYTWRKVTSVVHNIILGSLWIDQQGDMDIFNHTNGDKCHLKYLPCGMFGGNNKKVEGSVTNKQGQVLRTLVGHWDKQVEAFDVLNISSSNKLTLGPAKLLWSRNPPPPDSEKFYAFTLLACQLNEMEDFVAPTDSRRRPDQRLMENGQFDEANVEKLRLEERQRIARKLRVADVKEVSSGKSLSNLTQGSDTHHEISLADGGEPGYTPGWFKLQKDPITGKAIHIFTGEYWKCKEIQDWSRCPKIY